MASAFLFEILWTMVIEHENIEVVVTRPNRPLRNQVNRTALDYRKKKIT